jgi:hypothetical protein
MVAVHTSHVPASLSTAAHQHTESLQAEATHHPHTADPASQPAGLETRLERHPSVFSISTRESANVSFPRAVVGRHACVGAASQGVAAQGCEGAGEQETGAMRFSKREWMMEIGRGKEAMGVDQ